MRVLGIFLSVAVILAALGIVNLWRGKHPRRGKATRHRGRSRRRR